MSGRLQDRIDDAMRRGFLERLAQYDQASGADKIALELGTVVRAAERGTPTRTPAQIAKTLEGAANRFESAASRYHALPAGDPRKALAFKRMQSNQGLSTMTGAVQDEMASAAEKVRAAIPAPAPSATAHEMLSPDELAYVTKMRERLLGGKPLSRAATLPAEPLRTAGTKADLPRSIPRAANG